MIDVGAQLDALEATQRRASRISVAGVALLGIAAGTAALYTASLTKVIAERQQRITELDQAIDARTRKITVLESSAQKLEQDKEAFASRASSLEAALGVTLSDRVAEGGTPPSAPSAAVPKPREPAPPSPSFGPPADAHATVVELNPPAGAASPPRVRAAVTKLEGQVTTLPGTLSQLYAIDMWLEASAAELAQLKSVSYSMSRYYRVKPRLVGESAQGGFRVTTVPLWGCVGTVLVTMTDKQNKSRELVFDWCRAANWEARAR